MASFGTLKTPSFGLVHGFAFFTFSLTASCLVLAQSSVPNRSKSAPAMVFPVECEIGQSCLIQKLVDHDATTGRSDYRCGNLTTDGHDGVDIRLRTMDDMRSGYAVVASSAGKVLRTRDGEPDISSRERIGLQGKDAGNAIVIDHGDGWETQYSHLMLGSVAVKPGQQVASGERIGLIGMSGNSEFPHLHFSVRYRGTVIDPFTGTGQGSACSATLTPAGLWMPQAARALHYVPTAIISVGLASAIPPKAVANRSSGARLSGRHTPVILWADVIGAKPGDIQEFAITGPGGRTAHIQQVIVDGGGLSWFAYSGKLAPKTGWPAGQYNGRYKIRREGATIVEASASGIFD